MNQIFTTLCKVVLFIGLNLYVFMIFSQPGQNVNDIEKYKIGITTGAFTPEISPAADFQNFSDDSFDFRYFRLLQFYQIPSESQRNEWASEGLVLTDYLPGNVYYAVIEESFRLDELSSAVRAVLPVGSRFKMETLLYFMGIPGHALERGETAQMTLSYYKTLNPEQVMANLRLKGVEIEAHRSYSCQLDVSFSASRLEEITALPYIQFIGAQPEEPVLEGQDYRNATGRSNYLNTGYSGLNYDGAGVVIGIGEGGTVGNMIDVKGRLIELSAGSPESHKITVMKNAGGGGNLDPADRNNAWGADMLSVVTYPDYASLYSSHNLRYTNHSYGVSIAGGYDLDARDHDLRIASIPNHLVIYSAGNSGDQTGYAPYNFSDWANITGEMKQNKNMFTIGNLTASDELIYHSSRGPMYDGRIIPQLALAGFEGTSYSAPKVTGQMAMLAQIYKEKNSGNEPPSSLLRTIILNTADELGNPGPDFKHGYGRPNMRRAYHMINDFRYLTSSVAHGNTNTHNITLPANTKQVRVMIVWPDVAAAVNANPAIVNNLNLQANDPSSNIYSPWVLNHTANAYNLDLPATRGVDNINTIEQVTVDDPAAGVWSISVNGANVPSGPQTYYLTWEFLMDELHMAFPLENHKFIPGETYYLRWDSYGGTGTFILDYRVAGGSWINIVSGYDANSRVYTWIAPTVSSMQTIEFRVQRGSLTSASGVNYIGGVPENLRVFKVCNDEVTLKWSPVSGATSYKVYKLGTHYMEEVTSSITFDGTSAVLTGQSAVNSEYYAVSALTGTYEGQHTNAIEKAPGDYGCVAISWTGTVSTDWFAPGNWDRDPSLPTAADNVIIPSAPSSQPLIAAAGAECSSITIENGASLTMSGTTEYTFSVSGDWINNGTFTHGIGTVNFNGSNTYQEIAGSSATDFYILRVEKGAMANTLEANSIITLNATTPDARLQLISGTFKLSNSSSNIIAINTNGTAAANALGSGKRIWVHNGSLAVNSSWRLNAGELKITGGVVNVGNSNSQNIDFLNNGKIVQQGGELNVSAGIWGNTTTSTGSVTINGGILTVAALFNGFSRPAFEMNINTNFTMTGGTLVVRRRGTDGAGSDYFNHSNNAIVTGGTLQIGNSTTPASHIIRINSTVPVHNLLLNAHNSPTTLLISNDLTVSNDVTLDGGTLDLNSLNLNVGGYWNNNGHSATIGSTVVLNGSTAQTIGGSLATTFTNLTIDGADVDLKTYHSSKLTTVAGDLTINSGKKLTIPAEQRLTVNGTLTNANDADLVVASGATGTGSLIFQAGSPEGTVERYIAAATWNDWEDGWHFLSSPVSSQAISPAFTATPDADYDFYAWHEAQNTWVNFKNTTTPPTWNEVNTGTNFNIGSGYMVSYKNTDTKMFTGTLNKDDVTKSGLVISSGDNYGWHLLGNPYSSALTWYTDWTTSNIGGVANIWNEAGKSYSPVNAGEVIPSANGFMVQVSSGTGSITIPSVKRVHSAQAWYKNSNYPVIKLFARNLDKPSFQETLLRFNPASTQGFDHEYDGRFLPGYAPQFYSVNQGENLMVNSLPEITKELIIPFHFIKNEGKNFAIEAEGMETLDATCYLVDLKLNIIHDLSTIPVYGFKASLEDEPGRFILKFDSDLSGPDSPAESIIQVYGKSIYLLSRSYDVSVELYNVAGQLLVSQQAGRGLHMVHDVSRPGIYIVRVFENDQASTQKIAIP
jgi:hypothetical protein